MVFEGARIAAVVPAFNEEKMIAAVIETMPDFVDHIVIVDDCGTDGTSDIVRASADPRVELVRHEVNTGVGGAIITGHRAAVAAGSDVNVVMAGDAQMDPVYLPALLERVTTQGYGFAKANRFFSPESFRGMPKHRIFGNIVLSFMTKLASGYWNLFDPRTGTRPSARRCSDVSTSIRWRPSTASRTTCSSTSTSFRCRLSTFPSRPSTAPRCRASVSARSFPSS